jgi:hypothetical protein
MPTGATGSWMPHWKHHDEPGLFVGHVNGTARPPSASVAPIRKDTGRTGTRMAPLKGVGWLVFEVNRIACASGLPEASVSYHLRVEVRDVEARAGVGEHAGAVVQEQVLRLRAPRAGAAVRAAVREEDVVVAVVVHVGDGHAVGPHALRRQRRRVVGELLIWMDLVKGSAVVRGSCSLPSGLVARWRRRTVRVRSDGGSV